MPDRHNKRSSRMKKHSRWDHKNQIPPQEKKDNILGWEKWKAPNSSAPQLGNIDTTTENIDTQAPLDYSTDSRSRAGAETTQMNSDHNHNADSGEERFIEQIPQTVIPPLWSMYSNYSSFPSSSRNPSIPFPPPTWQSPGEYFMNNSYMKWSNQERLTSNQFGNSSQYNKKFKKSYNSYNVHSREQKEQTTFYNDYSKRYHSNKSQHDKQTSKENEFRADNLPFPKNKYLIDNRKYSPNQSNFSLEQKCIRNSNILPNKDFNIPYSRKKDNCYLRFRRGEKCKGFSKPLNNFQLSSPKGKHIQANKSAAEEANSKAFDAAASDLRQAYLANKSCKEKTKKKIVKGKGKSVKSCSKYANSDKCVPKSFQLKKKLWKSIKSKVVSKRKVAENTSVAIEPTYSSDNENYLTIDTDSDSEDSDVSINELSAAEQNLTISIAKNRRKRRHSDSFLSSHKHFYSSNDKRTRSRSVSFPNKNIFLPLEGNDLRSTILGKVKGLIFGHLDAGKNQIHDVINNAPAAKKLKTIIESLNNVSTSHFAEKILTKRMMLSSDESIECSTTELYQSYSNDERNELDILTDGVLLQVREILDMEANGEGANNLDEISLSIADLISGSIKKKLFNFPYEPSHNEHLESEIEILTPPPKTPATMITLADSDTDFHPNITTDSSSAKVILNSSSISPEMSFMSLSPNPEIQNVENSTGFNQAFPCVPQEPIIKRSLSSTACLLPIISTETTDFEESGSHLEDIFAESSNLDQKRKVSNQVLQEDTLCNITIPPPLVKVKEERPSPITECGLCMHSARSPHTPQCGFGGYDTASSPVPLISGPARTLVDSARMPVPRLPANLSHIFKHEKSEGATFLSLENIDRPSSEERPKNPAPPDTASNEPPSPLPIPPPESSLHPPPARQMLFSDNVFTEPPPPRPPPPPPLEHSPPIKFERRTPNSPFTCFCLRSGCDRSEHSDYRSSENRSSSHSHMRHARGTHLYKMETPYIPNARPRTPQNMMNLFAIPAVRPRCIIPNNNPPAATTLRLPGHSACTMVDMAVQTESIKLPEFIDKSTNIDFHHNQSIPNCEQQISNSVINNIFSGIDRLIFEVNSLSSDEYRNNFSFHQNLTECEDKAFQIFARLQKQEKEIYDKKNMLMKSLRDLTQLRRNQTINRSKLKKQCLEKAVNTDDIQIRVISPIEDMDRKLLKLEACENTSIVSSSQEVESRLDHTMNGYDIDCNQTLGERCTSTSMLESENISEGENSIEFESFVKEEHGPQEFETRTVCCVHENGDLPLHQTSGDLNTLTIPLSIRNIEQTEEIHIIEDDGQAKISNAQGSGDDIIIMGDLTPRKIIFSPPSPKTRNSSGSEHGYSLRSRGPPSDSYDYNSDSNQLKESCEHGNFTTDCSPTKRCLPDGCFNCVKNESVIHLDSSDITEETFLKKKRKRKTKKLGSSKRKRKICFDYEHFINLAYSSNSIERPKDTVEEHNSCVIMPAPIESSVLTIKIVGNFLFVGCSDSSAKAYDLKTGKLCKEYSNHFGDVTSLLILGKPNYALDFSHFTVVTGSMDMCIRFFNGMTANLILKKNATEPITCLEHRWNHIFIGTQGGCCIKWNLKDKKLGEKIKFCEKVITCILPHNEGGRKVLVVAAKSCCLMIRDAMSGLYLRNLEFAPLTVYSAIFHGNLFYTGGSEKKIIVYDICSGTIEDEINSLSSVSCLLLHSNHLIATCYDGFVRIININTKELIHTLTVDSMQKMFTCSLLYKNQIILGNKYGEVVSCQLPC